MLKYLEDIQRVDKENSTSFGEKMLLYWMIRELRPKTIVETGTHKGATTYMMAQAVLDNGFGRIITCDVIDYNPKQYTVPPLQEVVDFRICRGDELKIDVPIDFLFIDGAHEDWEVKTEVNHLLPKLRDGGTAVFHDCWPSPSGKPDVNSAITGFETAWLPTSHALRILTKGPPYMKPEGWSLL